MSETLDPTQSYLLLDTDGTAVPLPGGESFWNQVMSGRPTDPAVQRLMSTQHGRMLSMFHMDSTWTTWEMHPAGDEILFLVSGELTLVLDENGRERCIELEAGRVAIVPRGVWHTARIDTPCTLLALTDGLGTQHRPV